MKLLDQHFWLAVNFAHDTTVFASDSDIDATVNRGLVIVDNIMVTTHENVGSGGFVLVLAQDQQTKFP